MRVIQLGDEADVAPALSAALAGLVDVEQVVIRRWGAKWPVAMKSLALPLRYADARRVAGRVRSRRPDVVHTHWLPDALAGALVGCPWVLHVHGSDIRGVRGWRLAGYSRLLRSADAVVFSTPDLAPWVRRWRADASYLPTPIPPLELSEPIRYDVLVNAVAARAKGSEIAFEALRMLAHRQPALRLAAMDGPAFESGPWQRIPFQSKPAFHRLLASSRMIVGQFAAGALGIADLEALALGRPLITWLRDDLYPDSPPVRNARSAEEVVAAVLADAPTAGGPEWVARTHGASAVARQLLAIYHHVMEGR